MGTLALRIEFCAYDESVESVRCAPRFERLARFLQSMTLPFRMIAKVN
jgi:hypothetical protein